MTVDEVIAYLSDLSQNGKGDYVVFTYVYTDYWDLGELQADMVAVKDRIKEIYVG